MEWFSNLEQDSSSQSNYPEIEEWRGPYVPRQIHGEDAEQEYWRWSRKSCPIASWSLTGQIKVFAEFCWEPEQVWGWQPRRRDLSQWWRPAYQWNRIQRNSASISCRWISRTAGGCNLRSSGAFTPSGTGIILPKAERQEPGQPSQGRQQSFKAREVDLQANEDRVLQSTEGRRFG